MPHIQFDQSELLKVQGEEDNKGVCWALSMEWLRLSLSGASDAQAQRITSLTRWMPRAIAVQKQYEGMHQNTEPPPGMKNPGLLKALAMLEIVAKRVGGIELDRSSKTEIVMSMNATCDNIDAIVERLRTPGRGHMLSFQYKRGTGHAMATRARKEGFWYKMSPETFLFDPNGGELDMNAATLKNYITSHMKNNDASSLVITKMRLAA